jgi:hypothetical protein
MQGEQSAYNQKGDFYRQLLSQFTGNEKEFNKYAARLNALGIDTGIQGSSLSNDMNNNSDMYNQQQSQRNQFGQQVGGAALQNEMIQAQVKGGREDVRNQGILRRNALGVQEMGLRQGEANLANQWANNQLGARALDTQKVQQEIERHSLLQSLSMEDTYDIFSKQLLPNLRNSWSDTSAQQKLGLQTASQGVTDYQNDMNYNLTNMGLSREREANYTNTSNAEDLLDADYARQVQATEAAYNSSLGTNQSSLAAALAQIASNQYGVLSSLSSGGGGGGFNWGGLSGLISQAAQIFGGMSGNGSSGTQGYSTYNNSYGTQSSNFSRRSSGSGQYAGTQSNGVF